MAAKTQERLVGATEAAELAGVRPETIHYWARQHKDFPKPIKRVNNGRAWDWAQIEAWMKKTAERRAFGPKAKRKSRRRRG